ncbi:MAG: TetR/AcrR family transcriptional regulator [Lentisphaeria bacterium]
MARHDSAQRQRILEAAVGVFADHGLKGATTRLVGQAAGVNSALIYYYFEDKETLFTEVIRLVLRDFLEHLGQGRRPFSDARDRLGYLVDGIFSYYSSQPQRLRLMPVILSLPPDRFGRTVSELLRETPLPAPLAILAEGMAAGELRALPPLPAWWDILGLCLFNLHLNKIAPHLQLPAPVRVPSATARRDAILDLLMAGLAGRGHRQAAKASAKPAAQAGLP